MTDVEGIGTDASMDATLLETLSDLGIADDVLTRQPWVVVAQAEAQDDPMVAVYKRLNDDLQAQVESEHRIAIRHITGEARVLVDPAHRNVMAANDLPTMVACRQLPAGVGRIVDGVTFIAAQLARWRHPTYDDIVDIVYLCATGRTRVAVMADEARIHFSLYGIDRVLLQAQHVHPMERKRLWYLRSTELVNLLDARAEAYMRNASPVPMTSFQALLEWLVSPPILAIGMAKQVTHEMLADLSNKDVELLKTLGIFAVDDITHGDQTGQVDSDPVSGLKMSATIEEALVSMD